VGRAAFVLGWFRPGRDRRAGSGPDAAGTALEPGWRARELYEPQLSNPAARVLRSVPRPAALLRGSCITGMLGFEG